MHSTSLRFTPTATLVWLRALLRAIAVLRAHIGPAHVSAAPGEVAGRKTIGYYVPLIY